MSDEENKKKISQFYFCRGPRDDTHQVSNPQRLHLALRAAGVSGRSRSLLSHRVGAVCEAIPKDSRVVMEPTRDLLLS